MVQDAINKVAVGSKAGIVPVLDVVSRHLVSSLIGTFASATRLVVAAVREQLVPYAAVCGLPHADIGV
ncbi:hypothetical protein D3C73_1598290 [compost metagenome]